MHAKRSLATALALLAALGAAAPCALADGSGTRTASSRIGLRIVVPVVAAARSWTHPERLVIEERDVQRGYVDLDEVSSMRLTSNSRAGYSVGVSFDSRILAAVTVRLQGQVLEFSSDSRHGNVMASRMADAPVRVGYRLHLGAGVAPGAYRWPVAVCVGAAS